MSDDKKLGPRPLTFPRKRTLIDPRTIHRQLQQERATAPQTVDPLLADTPPERWPDLVERAELLTCGALERLGKLFAQTLGKDPKHALAIAELGVALAEAIPDSTYPKVMISQARAHAWKDLGKALRSLGRHEESIKALEHADGFVKDNGALMHDVAIVRFNLAVTLQELGRYEESLRLLNESRAIFRTFGDTPRLVFCGIAEGVLLQRLRKYREAREVYLLTLASTTNIELESRAAIHQAIGFCSIELNDLNAAEANLEEAARLNQQLGRPIEILKIELGRGRLYVRREDYVLALHHLTTIRRRFLKHSMPEEAGLCGLEMVDACLSLSRFEDAERLSKTLVREFTAAHLNTRAITALGYLAEAIESRKASSKTVADVREYIVSLRTEPERDFALA